MERIVESDITVDPTERGVFMKQDNDIIIVDLTECKKMRDVFARIVESQEPVDENIKNGENLRTTRVIARSHIQQLRRDVAYEEGRMSVLDSVLED